MICLDYLIVFVLKKERGRRAVKLQDLAPSSANKRALFVLFFCLLKKDIRGRGQ